MISLSTTPGRLLLHLLESEGGLTEAGLELRAAGPVRAELESLVGAGWVNRTHDRFALTPAAAPEVAAGTAAELARLGRAGALYFAYGSNLDPWQVYLGERPVIPQARFLCRAMLPGFRVAFPRSFPLWIGWVASVVPAPDASAWGVLYLVDPPGWEALDRFERVPDDYTREGVTVSVPLPGAGPLPVPVQTYIHLPDGSAGGPPAASYMGRVLRGARAFGLPQDYLAWLEGIETIPDEAGG